MTTPIPKDLLGRMPIKTRTIVLAPERVAQIRQLAAEGLPSEVAQTIGLYGIEICEKPHVPTSIALCLDRSGRLLHVLDLEGKPDATVPEKAG